MDESNFQAIQLIDKYKIQSSQFFPIFGFNNINQHLVNAHTLKKQQIEKLKGFIEGLSTTCKVQKDSVQDVINIASITPTNKINTILYSVLSGGISVDDCEQFLRTYPTKNTTEYRRLLCAYDFKKYGAEEATIVL